MSITTHSIDSDSEDVGEVHRYRNFRDYVGNLGTTGIIHIEDRTPASEVMKQLGLAMHHYTDRVMETPALTAQYREAKGTITLSAREYGEGVEAIKAVLGKDAARGLIENYNPGETDPRYHIAIFNNAFNAKSPLPDGVTISEGNRERLNILLKTDHGFERTKGRFLGKKEGEFVIHEMDVASLGPRLLAYPELVRRVDRSHMKMGTVDTVIHSIKSDSTGHSSSYISKLTLRQDDPASVKDNLHIPHMSTYDKIWPKAPEQRLALAEATKSLMTNGTIPDSPHITTKEVVDFTNLMLVETARNRVTATTLHMFLDKVIHDPTTDHTAFPMHQPGSQDAIRGICHFYADKLPNGQKYDFASPEADNQAKANTLLTLEGKALVDWMVLKGSAQARPLQQAFAKEEFSEQILEMETKLGLARGATTTPPSKEAIVSIINLLRKTNVDPILFDSPQFKLLESLGNHDRPEGMVNTEELRGAVTAIKSAVARTPSIEITQDLVQSTFAEGIAFTNREIYVRNYGVDIKIEDIRHHEIGQAEIGRRGSMSVDRMHDDPPAPNSGSSIGRAELEQRAREAAERGRDQQVRQSVAATNDMIHSLTAPREVAPAAASAARGRTRTVSERTAESDGSGSSSSPPLKARDDKGSRSPPPRPPHGFSTHPFGQ